MKIAIVHDFLNQFGGAERVVAVLHEMFPDAPIYTSIFNKGRMPQEFGKMDIRTSFMQNLPLVMEKYRYYFWLYPKAFESFDLSEYDLIISSSSAYAKGINKRSDAIHICYCYNPMRFVWRYENYIKKEDFPWFIKSLLPGLLTGLKKWDLRSNEKVDCFVAISKEIEQRIKHMYQRDSVLIYPPIEVSLFDVSKNEGDYFLIVARLSAYKRIDLAVEAFSKLQLPLKIAGNGPAKNELQKKAKNNVEFLGKVSDTGLKELYSNCKALVVTGEEDFGIAPLEAAASGKPTIAFRAGGALETVVDKKTGIFFDRQDTEALVAAVKSFNQLSFDKLSIRQQAEKFDKQVFKEKMLKLVSELISTRR
ncbi:glycosyltransferase [Candidatus Margulisiibacteriota bacterium]